MSLLDGAHRWASLVLSWVIIALVGFTSPSVAVTVIGDGTSLFQPMMKVWIDRYMVLNPNVTIQYNRRVITNASDAIPNDNVDFTATVLDAKIDDPTIQALPVLVTPLVCVYRIPGINSMITFSRELLADVWRGAVTNWNHSSIRALNPGIDFPNAPIILIPPSSNSVVTLAFTSALCKFSSAFRKAVGQPFGEGSVFKNLSNNVQPYSGDIHTIPVQVQNTPFSVGITPLADAIKYGVPFTTLLNNYNYSTFPLPSSAIEDLQSTSIPANLTLNVVDLPGAVTYPLLATIYCVIRMNHPNGCERAVALDRFFRWLLTSAYLDAFPAAEALGTGYFPVPSTVSNAVLSRMLQMTCKTTTGYQLVRPGVTSVNAGGATQTSSAMDNFIGLYSATHNSVQMTYTRLGSQAGIQRMGDRLLDFGMSEFDATEADFAKGDMQFIPMFVSAIAIVCNVPGISTGVSLFFSREVIVGIWNGTIVNWNDPMITRLNPFVYLTEMPIKFAIYSTTNAATKMFKRALNSFDPNWGKTYDQEWTPTWPEPTRNRTVGASTWTGVATLVQTTPYSIAIVPRQTQVTRNLFAITIPNKQGRFVLPTLDTIASAVQTAVFDNRFQSNIIDRDAQNAYPIVSFTYLILHHSITTSDCTPLSYAAKFALWLSENATLLALARSIDYIPAFGEPNELVRTTLSHITCNGVVLLPELLPPVITTTTVPIGAIIGPVVACLLLIGAAVFYVYRKYKQRLMVINQKLNDASVAVELSDAIATFDLDKMTFLEKLERPTTTQLSCLRILRTLKMVKKYIPPAVLCALQVQDEDENEDGADNDGQPAESKEALAAGGAYRTGGGGESASNAGSAKRTGAAGLAAPRNVGSPSQGTLGVPPHSLEVVSLPSNASSSTIGSSSHNADQRSRSSVAGRINNKSGSFLASAGDAVTRLASSLKARSIGSSDSLYKKLGGGAEGGSGMVSAAARGVRKSISTSTSLMSSDEGKMLRRAVTTMFIRLTNFNTLLKADATDTVRAYNGFMAKVHALINEARGTVAVMESEYLLVHWNVSKKNASGCILACELSVKLLHIAQSTPFVIQMGLAHGSVLYTTIGCEAMSCFSLLGAMVGRVELLQRLNQHYGSIVLADADVKQRGSQDALFLVDIINCGQIIPDRTKIYELLPSALVPRTDFNDEWLYSFHPENQAGAPRQKDWQQCVYTFYTSGPAEAQEPLSAFVTNYSSDSAAAPIVTIAKQMLEVTSGGLVQAVAPSDCSPASSPPRSPTSKHTPTSTSSPNRSFKSVPNAKSLEIALASGSSGTWGKRPAAGGGGKAAGQPQPFAHAVHDELCFRFTSTSMVPDISAILTPRVD